jgi:hypothetical protein
MSLGHHHFESLDLNLVKAQGKRRDAKTGGIDLDGAPHLSVAETRRARQGYGTTAQSSRAVP